MTLFRTSPRFLLHWMSLLSAIALLLFLLGEVDRELVCHGRHSSELPERMKEKYHVSFRVIWSPSFGTVRGFVADFVRERKFTVTVNIFNSKCLLLKRL